MEPRRLIIDTDVGTDVDDLLTLAMVPALEGVALEAVTLVYGDTDLRARITRVACDGLGLDVPIVRGVEQPLSGKAVMWAGHEGEGIDGLDDATYDDRDAVDVLIEQAAIEPGTLDILAIGPLTNIASAVLQDPTFARNVRHLNVMGGELRRGWPEHNFSSDAVATWIVLNAGVPMTITPLDQTLRVLLRRDEVERIESGSPIGSLLGDQTRRCWQWLNTFVSPGHRDQNAPHDPMALLALTQPALFELRPMRLDLSARGDGAGVLRGEPDESSTINVVVDLDPDAVRDAVLNALVR